jgi:hypothetical protein
MCCPSLSAPVEAPSPSSEEDSDLMVHLFVESVSMLRGTRLELHQVHGGAVVGGCELDGGGRW